MPDVIKETYFYRILDDNNIFFPLWENLTFTDFWIDYINSKEKKELVIAGRGAAKTFTTVFKHVYGSFEDYINGKISGKKRRPGVQYHLMIIAPTTESYAPIIQLLDEMVPEIPGVSEGGIKNYRRVSSNNKASYKLFGRNEFQISVYSSYNAESLRGKSADRVICSESKDIPRDAIESVISKIVNRQGGYAGYWTLEGSPDTPETQNKHDLWFDRACDEADPALPQFTGYYSRFKLFSATWRANPYIDDNLLEEISSEKLLNPLKYERERNAKRNLIIPVDFGAAGSVFSLDAIKATWYTDKPTIASMRDLIIGIDSAYGGGDAMVRIVFCKRTNRYIDITIVDAKDIKDATKKEGEEVKTVRQFILDTAKQYPGAMICYDKSGRLGSSLPSLLPPSLRLVPVDRNNSIKNRHVETLVERMSVLNAQGKCEAIGFPDPSSSWLSQRQRECFERLYVEMVNYHEAQTTDHFGKITGRKYTKIPPYSDDCIDSGTMIMDQINPLVTANRINPRNLINARRKFM